MHILAASAKFRLALVERKGSFLRSESLKMPNQREIAIQSFNPYEFRFPGRRVVSRDTLHLIKRLRTNGYEVVVAPDNGSKLYYLTRKGVSEFFADPVLVSLVSIPVNFIVSLLATLVANRLESGRTQPKDNEVRIILESGQGGDKRRFDYRGKPLNDNQFREILDAFKGQEESYRQSTKIIAPDSTRPTPIFLEHTPKIVGWARVWLDKNGGLAAETKITDDDVLEGIQNGTMKGYSYGGLVSKATCSICQQEYVNCNHIAGEVHRRKECVVELKKIDPAEISIVSDPVQVGIEFSRIRKNKS